MPELEEAAEQAGVDLKKEWVWLTECSSASAKWLNRLCRFWIDTQSFQSNEAESPLCHLVVSACANEHYDSPRSVRLLGGRERKGAGDWRC